jgi:hypothetical protein
MVESLLLFGDAAGEAAAAAAVGEAGAFSDGEGGGDRFRVFIRIFAVAFFQNLSEKKQLVSQTKVDCKVDNCTSSCRSQGSGIGSIFGHWKLRRLHSNFKMQQNCAK